MKNRIIETFREKFGTEPEVVVRSPGRVNLIGEHTDYNDGFVMPLAVERATWIALRRGNLKGARLYSLDFDEWSEVDGQGFVADERKGSWIDYFAGVAGEIFKKYPGASGWEGASLSDLPIGAGLSSSASFELAVAKAFAAVSRIPWDATEMALLAHRAEVHGVGVNCGTMDQLAVALGRKDHALLIDCRSLDVRAIPLPKGCAIVIMDTTKARTLAGSAYNERRSQCEEAARILGQKSLRDVSVETFRMRESELDSILAKRARHVITENDRTVSAAAAMEKNDGPELGRLMNESHESLRTDYEVSCDELDLMVAAAREEEGCYGARMTGAGFGGCAVALVQQGVLEKFMTGVRGRYQGATGLEAKLYPTGAHEGTTSGENVSPSNAV